MRADEIIMVMIAATACLSILMFVAGAMVNSVVREWKREDGS